MAAHVIVLANRTASAPELIEALVHRGERGPIHATLVMPAAGPGESARAECRARLDKTLEAWRACFDSAEAQGRLPAGFDRRFCDLWRFYLMYCEGGFRGGGITVRQVTLAKR